MKRITFRVLIGVLAFGLGFAAVLLYLKFGVFNSPKTEETRRFDSSVNEDNAENLRILNYCELAENPQKYNDKIVRLKGRLTFGLEGAWFSEKNCGADNAAVISYYDKKVGQKFDEARKQKNNKFLSNEIELNVKGKFKNSAYRGGGLSAPFQFEILEIE